MNLRLSEPLIEAVKTKLQANIAARIATINADPNLPAIAPALSAPDQSAYYTAPLDPMPPAMPAIVVMDGNMVLDPNGEGPHSLVTDTEIGIFIVDEHFDRQTLGKRLQRLNRAVIESLYDSDPKEQLALAGGGVAFWLMPTRIVPGPVFDTTVPDRVRSFYMTVFTVRQVEE